MLGNVRIAPKADEPARVRRSGASDSAQGRRAGARKALKEKGSLDASFGELIFTARGSAANAALPRVSSKSGVFVFLKFLMRRLRPQRCPQNPKKRNAEQGARAAKSAWRLGGYGAQHPGTF